MKEEMLIEIIKSTITGEEHLGDNLKEQCVEYINNLQSQLKAKEEVIETIKRQLYNAINILKDVDDETNKIIKECMTGTLSQIIELEEILSKGENK